MKSTLENARKLQREADCSKDSKQKVNLYTAASKEYLSVANRMTDQTVKVSLIYLANSATHSANTILHLTQNMPTDPLLQQEQLDKSLGKAKISGPISEVSDSMYAQRLMFKAHQSRLSNINKIPKAVPVSGPGAVRDLLTLEAKLNELGFSRDSKYHRSLQEEHNRRSSPSTDPALSHSSARMSSDLGESFMVLKPAGTGVGLKPETSSAAVRSVGGLVPKGGELKVFASSPPQSSPLVGEPILAAYGGGSSVKIKNVAAHQRADSTGSIKGASTGPSGGSFSSTGVTPTSTTSSPSSTTTWANNLLNWGGFGSGSGSAADTSRVSPAGGKSSVAADIAQVGGGHHQEDQTLSWNEQSLMLASRDTTKGVTTSSLLQSGVRSVSSRDSSPDKSSGRAIASAVFEDLSRSTLRSLDGEGHNSEGVSNLLKTVNRLGEENAQLLSRIELMSQVEARQRQMEREVETFKQEYSEKFKNVKRALREYSTKFQAEDNPVSVATKALQESAEADKALQRQQDLERTVQALLGRLQKATVELNRKDSLLRAIDPKYAAQPPEKSSKSSSSSDLPAGAGVGGRGIAMSPETEQQHSHSSHNVQQQSRQHHLSLATTSSSRHVSGGSSRPSAGSPGPSKRQSSVSLPSKHPSTATLEALQKSKQQS